MNYILVAAADRSYKVLSYCESVLQPSVLMKLAPRSPSATLAPSALSLFALYSSTDVVAAKVTT